MLDAFLRDLKRSGRLFLQSPGFTGAAVAVLAIGIATNTAIFPVINTVLLKPFAYPHADRLVMFQNTFLRAPRTGSAAPVEFNWWRRQAAFEDVSAYAFNMANLTGDAFPEQIPTMQVGADFFRLCGANALLGRTFEPRDDVPNAARTVVLAYAFWQNHFAGDGKVIGGRITLGGERYEIIGVAPPSLRDGQIAEQSLLSGDIEIDAPPDVYIPFQLDPHSADRGHYFNVAGRLKPGITLAAANEQLRAGYGEYARRWTDLTPGAGFGVQPLQDAIVGSVRGPLLILLGAVSLVLLIACANVANLLLARAVGRRHEIAIRTAVGAGRGQLVRQLLAESILLSLAGGALGLAAGYAGIRALLAISPAIPRIGAAGANVSLDWRVSGFTLGLSLVTGVLAGLVPALGTSPTDLSSALKASGRHGATEGSQHGQARALLMATEMALALVLLIGAALLIRSLIALRQVNPGFNSHTVLTMRMSLTGPGFEKSSEVARVMRDGLRRIRALPDVEAAATACCVPLDSRLQVGFEIAGRHQGPPVRGVTGWVEVSAGYFETFQIPLLRGRVFTERDEGGPPVAILNQTLAGQLWPDADPLNRQIRLGDGAPLQIIGVVADVHDRGLNRDSRPNLYVASVTPGGLLRQIPWAWVIRTRAAPASLSAAIQKELRQASGGLPVGQARTMDEILSRSMAAQNFHTRVLTIFGCAALLLAAIGIYSVMAHSVVQRRHEIGIRLALGAEAGQIRNMVVLQGMRLALTGVACGLVAAFGLTRWIAGFLFGVKARDPLVFCLVPVLLTAVALLAVWLPAMRASRVDPIRALRQE